ncbi:VOC family protein [Thalassotalea euphylliae]|uniref:VOC family protein n=1 Tax=Thalassotalea euphylliae TaxID=1655234 RepID=A0A3E0U0G2_9GAMM|nr:VOC family protein [Thalassotalea euphylliae]REL30416.1 VOC family protein [Thalassotalea euphylliae]
MSTSANVERNKSRTICHASIGTNDLVKAKAFYQPVLATLDIDLVSEYEHALAFGKGYPEFWVQIPFDKQPMSSGNGVHFGFVAKSHQQVENFYQQALALGAKCNGKPGPRPDYGEPYYGCFVIDPEGNKIEASFWDFNYSSS